MISINDPARLISVCVSILSLATATACSVSPERELSIGASEAAQVDSQMPLIRDTAVTNFVTRLGEQMAKRTSRADLNWRFSVVDAPDVNAFAIPGGYIYVDRGAIEQADRLDELAGIVGHEIGHVVQRHSVKQIEQAERGTLGVVVFCTLTHSCRTIGSRLAIRIGADLKTARYSQRDEAQADSEGVVNTMRVGIDPEGLPAFFQKLFETRKTQPSLVESFFSTHPADESRVAATRKQIAGLSDVGLNLLQDTPEFHAIQARVKAMPPPPKASSKQ
jgi:predicted Zn-dependent protease